MIFFVVLKTFILHCSTNHMALFLTASLPGLQTILVQSLHLFMCRLINYHLLIFHSFSYTLILLSRLTKIIKNPGSDNQIFASSLQTVAGEKVEGQGGRRTRTSSVSSTSSRFQKSQKRKVLCSAIFRDGGVPQGHRGFLQPRLRDQAPSKVYFHYPRAL